MSKLSILYQVGFYDAKDTSPNEKGYKFEISLDAYNQQYDFDEGISRSEKGHKLNENSTKNLHI